MKKVSTKFYRKHVYVFSSFTMGKVIHSRIVNRSQDTESYKGVIPVQSVISAVLMVDINRQEYDDISLSDLTH